MAEIKSLEHCYCIADSIEGESDARSAINFAAYTAQMYRRFTKELAWACVQSSAAKRREALEKVLMEMDANSESRAEFPSRQARGSDDSAEWHAKGRTRAGNSIG